MTRKVLPWTGIAVFIIVWYALCLSGVANPTFVDPPHKVFKTLLALLGNAETWSHIFATLRRTLVGFLLAALAGIPTGMFLGYSFVARTASQSMLDFLRSIPATALIPLFILCFGIGETANIAFVVFAAGPIITVYTMLGVKNCSKTRQDFAQTLGASKAQVFAGIVFFETLPSAFAGLRTSISLTLILVVVGEMIMLGSRAGLGAGIYLARYSSEYAKMYALIIICGVLGYALNKAFQAIGEKLIHWAGR